jgi:hypothetical protein
LAGCPGVRTPEEEEGLCELAASWWLQFRTGPLASHLLANMKNSSDPTYGDGYRTALALAAGRAPSVIAKLVVTGMWGRPEDRR